MAEPTKITIPWARDDGSKTAIPDSSQIGIVDGRASFPDGFVPLNGTPKAAGGIPPFKSDMNGILYAITNVLKWVSSGGLFKRDATFQTAIGGYPVGAILLKADNSGYWMNTVDNNASNPDAGGAGWQHIDPRLYALAGGTSTAYAATFDPAITALSDGMIVSVDIAGVGTNTTAAPTFSPNGLTAYTIKKQAMDGTIIELAISDIPKRATLKYVATGTYWLLDNPVTKGRLIEVKRFKTAGAFTFDTASGNLPYGTSHVLFKAAGAGGGGGGTSNLGALNYKSCGAGGSSGGLGEKLVATRSSFVGITLTVGAKGVGADGVAGTNGGTTSVGALMTCTGGGGGGAGTFLPFGNSSGITSGTVGAAGTSVGGDINIDGQYGGSGLLSYSNGMGGDGASSPYGTGGPRVEGNYLTGSSASGNAAAGGGASSSSGTEFQAAHAGGDGADGIIEAYCYG